MAGLEAGAAALLCAGPVASRPGALARSRAGVLEGGRGSVSLLQTCCFEAGRAPRVRVLAGLRAGTAPFHCAGPVSSRPGALREVASRAGVLEGGRGSVSLLQTCCFEAGRAPRVRVLAGLRAGTAPFHCAGPVSSRPGALREVACWRA
eukprot:tig00000169_g11914.t1